MAPVQSIKFQTANFPIFCARIIVNFWTTCTAKEVFSLVIMGNGKQVLPVLHCLEVVIAFVSSLYNLFILDLSVLWHLQVCRQVGWRLCMCYVCRLDCMVLPCWESLLLAEAYELWVIIDSLGQLTSHPWPSFGKRENKGSVLLWYSCFDRCIFWCFWCVKDYNVVHISILKHCLMKL